LTLAGALTIGRQQLIPAAHGQTIPDRPPIERSRVTERISELVRREIVGSFRRERIDELLTGDKVTRMLKGDAVSRDDQIRFGLVAVNGGCSGVLLNNQWAMTAGHCFRSGVARTATITFLGTTVASSHVYAFGGETFTMPPGSKDLRGPDLALVRTAVPFNINGSTTGFRNSVLRTGDSALNDRLLLIYGQGINSLPVGLFPALGSGTYRFGLLQVARESTSFRVPLIEAKPIFNPGPVCAFGDSGGPMFVMEPDGPKIVSIVETGDITCDPPGPCTAQNTTEIRSCKGPKVYNHWETIGDIIATTWNLSAPFVFFDVGGAEWGSMGEINGEVDVNRQPWAASARSSNEMCYNRGFVGGHFNGHQLRQKFGLACAGVSGAAWRDATTAEINATPWPFANVNQTSWAQANRAAARLCEQGGFVGGHFNGHMAASPSGGNLFGLVCYRAPAARFDATVQDLAGPWQVTNVDTVEWAHAARAAHDFCRRRAFQTGFMNGHQFAGGKFGIICH
jgi:hypothetical protein